MKQFSNLFILILFCFPLLAEDINKTFFGNLAVNGYDVVSYFKDGKPVLGNAKFQWEWKSVKWRFSSEENLNLFKKTPEKYAPQYGGYCAFAMSAGDKYDISPDAWNITNGKLYLNYDSEIHEKWEKKKLELIKQADTFWQKYEK